MINTNKNWSMKIIGGIFAALNLVLILGGLVSCGVGEQERSQPTEQQQRNQSDRDDDEQDNQNNQKDDSDDDKDDDD